MSNTASDYDIMKLHIGITLAVLSTIFSIVVAWLTQRLQTSGIVWLSLLVPIYGAMMFASSFVEEEHHFWYWLVSGWMAWLQFSTYEVPISLLISLAKLSSHYRKESKELAPQLGPIISLAFVRISRRWNQTGQKHSGAPDIGRTFLQSHNIILWTLVVGTYTGILYRIGNFGLPRFPKQASFAIACTISGVALGFKTAFTKADAPELLSGFWESPAQFLLSVSLVTQARIVFAGIALTTSLVVFSHFRNAIGGR